MENTHEVRDFSNPDSLEAAGQSLDNLIAFVKERAAVGEIHDAIFSDVLQYLNGMKSALNSHE